MVGGYFPAEQQVIRDKYLHPSDIWEEYAESEIEQSIGERFEQIAARFPHKPAIQSAGVALTYTQLNALSNQIAHTILAREQARVAPVALLLTHDARAYAAVLAILKSGRPYVVLDVTFPTERLAYLFADSQATLILTDQANAPLAAQLSEKPHTCIVVDESIDKNPTTNLNLAIAPDQVATITYTSGSTGEPKGVYNSHRNVLQIILRTTNACYYSQADRLGHVPAFGSSSGVFNVLTAILNGATAILYSLQTEGDEKMVAWLAAERINTIFLITTAFRQLVETLARFPQQMLPDLRLLIVGGERITQADVKAYRCYFAPHCILSMGYGVTELISTAFCFLDKQTPLHLGTTPLADQVSASNAAMHDHSYDGLAASTAVPTGYPLQGIEILILNDEGQRLEANQIGEVALRSPYLALGYWGKPELTKAKFLPDPVDPSYRIYQTGDVGLLRVDGCLVHLGRKDEQVKIRGYRVETIEVEHQLLQLDAVNAALVLAQPDHLGEEQLVAYLVVTKETAPSVTAVRRHLSTHLPDYMVPTAFVFLDELPLLPTGKVNRRALPAPGHQRPTLDTPYAPPTTPLEKELTTLWAEILGLEAIGIHDPFLDLGGHSLQAMRIVVRVQDTYAIQVPLTEFFAAETVAKMAVVVLANLVTDLDADLPPDW